MHPSQFIGARMNLESFIEYISVKTPFFLQIYNPAK